ncbi:MAG: hypothetical protein SGJ27_08725 [Candidatus Melainabacteria bacterium]|nr:hypothetical protein [Candidatus Melainabacteria bacterium]
MPTKSKTLRALVLAAAGIALAIALVPSPVSIIEGWTTSFPPVTHRSPCQGISGGPYPSRSPTTIVLPNADREVRIGYDCYVENTKVETRLEYKNGMKEFIRYRADRTVFERTKHYATVNGDLGRLQSYATYGPDGSTFTRHDVYRTDGTLERSGLADRDGSYVSRFFFDDGVAVERFRKFNKLKEFVSETQFRRDGSQLAGVVVSHDGLELGVTLYGPDGKKTAIFYRTKIGEKGYVYGPDGITILLEYANDPYYKVAGHSDEKGRLLQKWDTRFNRRVVAFLSQDETRTYTQVWREGDAPALRKVEEHDFSTKKLIRIIEMNKDGTKVAKIIVDLPGEQKLVSLLDDSGAIVQIDRYNAQGKLADSNKLAQPKPVDVPEEALTTPKPIASPPGFRLYGPALVYDWE